MIPSIKTVWHRLSFLSREHTPEIDPTIVADSNELNCLKLRAEIEKLRQERNNLRGWLKTPFAQGFFPAAAILVSAWAALNSGFVDSKLERNKIENIQLERKRDELQKQIASLETRERDIDQKILEHLTDRNAIDSILGVFPNSTVTIDPVTFRVSLIKISPNIPDIELFKLFSTEPSWERPADEASRLAIAALKNLRQLKHLAIDHTELDTTCIATIATLHGLASIDCQCNPLDPHVLAPILRGGRRFENLSKIAFPLTELADCTHFGDFPALEELCIRKATVHPIALATLPATPSGLRLKFVDCRLPRGFGKILQGRKLRILEVLTCQYAADEPANPQRSANVSAAEIAEELRDVPAEYFGLSNSSYSPEERRAIETSVRSVNKHVIFQ